MGYNIDMNTRCCVFSWILLLLGLVITSSVCAQTTNPNTGGSTSITSSTILRPRSPTSLTTGVTTSGIPVSNESYAATAYPCPAVIICPKENGEIMPPFAAQSIPVQYYCPYNPFSTTQTTCYTTNVTLSSTDIEQSPSYQSLLCPTSCTVTRTVTTATPTPGSMMVTSTAPVCPDGYTETHAYQTDREIGQTPMTVPAPIPYNDYLIAYQPGGYNCTATGAVYTVNSGNCITYGSDLCQYYPSTPTNIGGTLGRYSCAPSTCYTNCSFVLPTSCSGFVSQKYTITYQYLQCATPVGLYYTANRVPSSVMCTRAKGLWH